ncbi:MAG: deacylase [Flavobacteriaceae bacterium]|nr:deacylase [Flavobacteriaceae bacterium]
MRALLTTLIVLLPFIVFSQEPSEGKKTQFVFTPEWMTGITADANKDFVEHGLTNSLYLNFGWENDGNPQEWAQRLKGPRTGFSVSLTDYGNRDSLGMAVTAMPFVEFEAFRKKNLKIQVGMGGSYFTRKYDSITNPQNQGITTDVVWSFRAFMHYQFLSGEKLDWRLGVGYFHHSNGHTRLPNQGLNSFLFSLSADVKNNKSPLPSEIPISNFDRSIYSYVSFRFGYGANVLSKPMVFNDNEPIYSVSGEYGKVLNNTFKLGVGFYYRYYGNYYNYIVDNESLVQEGREFEHFKDSPTWYASAIGLHLNGEVMLNHVGLNAQIGANLFKPGYRIDWRLNEGWNFIPRTIPADNNFVLGEFDSQFKMKHIIHSRMGIKYYFVGTNTEPRSNVFVGFHINTNLGQADYTDVSLGYVYNFGFRKR